ncbi:MAG: SCP2 sterol-binding domain-containing protein [Syntrophales bacterium]|nr:SCP2 sterol-binding domain-containing protein [Syntrophales bacterium]MDD4338823.1 SCP2 sterol-binding domain-containing protein [Syntrophales bacterium]HOG06694.1 SCP2 sterol-binding domain-containing protein [Syntrophales bacterium]HOS77661.1 SCP2 sterol-binding domain-containing protein [Syntrophales bacterium]HQN25792.1 SCP2 sterol-binding domain-containing protein [Syntrophales bacterium]
MSETFKYLSPEWAEEGLKRLKTQIPAEKMHNVTTSMSNIYTNCPGGGERYLFIGTEQGVFTRVEVGEGEPPPAEFRIIGEYETFARITRAELGAQRAMMTGKLKLKGNMAKALKLAALADRMNKVLATIPAEY